MRGLILKAGALRHLFCLMFFAVATVSATATISVVSASVAEAAVVSRIDVRGNTRMDDGTVKSFLTIQEGVRFDNADIDDSVKALFATGLFGDVAIYQAGNTLVVEVDENAIINEVFFEGNKRLSDERLNDLVQSKPRGIYAPEIVASDVDQIDLAYDRTGRSDATVSYEVVPLARNRVNVVFRVNEGGKTNINSVTFIGNNAFNSARLRQEMSTKRSNLLSWLTNNDIYDPDKLAADEERLRRFYFNNGYADFQIVSTSAVLDEVENEYNITITVDEGQRYRYGNINIETTLNTVDVDSLYSLIETRSGSVYSAKDVEDSIIAITESVASGGYAFVDVVPRGSRNFDTATIDITYLVDQGARVYVDRIVIVGNERTREYVIRREFDFSEGDALNQVYIQRAKRRLDGLGLFESVQISTRPGSSPDRADVVVRVLEKASGEFAVGGGYSTAGGVLGEISFTEKNFMGRGQTLSVSGSFGEAEENYRLSFTEPYFLGYRLSAGFDIGRNSIDAGDSRKYSSETTYGNIRFGAPLTDNSSISVFYSYSDSTTSIADSLLDPGKALAGGEDGLQGNRKGEISAAFAPPVAPGDWVSSGFGYSFKVRTLDDVVTPREGYQFELSQTGFGAGGDASYIKSEIAAQAYVTLSEEFDLVGMVRGRAGANTILDDDGYRALDNFFQGSRQIRGFANNGFGPRDPGTGDALGGMYYWNATAEVNFPAPFIPESYGLRAALFADAGSLWGVDGQSKTAIRTSNGTLASALGDVEDDAVRASVGASIIWNSPFGPLRFDYAEPIMSEKYDEIRRFNFGISSTF